MLKKYMIFGSVVLLVAALLTLTGCSQATDSDGGTTAVSERNYLYGDANADDVRIAVQAAKDGNRIVVLGENLRLTGSSTTEVADFKDMVIRIEKNVTVRNMIINAAFATLSFDEGSEISLDTNAVFIYSGEPKEKLLKIVDNATAKKVKYVDNPLIGTQGTDQGIAVLEYTIGSDFSNLHGSITNLYVLEKITIDAGSIAQPGDGKTAGIPRIIALGEVDLAASNARVFANLSHFIFADSATLTSKIPGLTLTLPSGPVYLPAIDAPVPLTIEGPSGAIGAITIGAINGPGTVTLSPANNQNITGLSIGSVSESGRVQVSVTGTGTLGATVIGGNAGSISLSAAGLSGPVTIGTSVSKTANSGTIAITIPTIAQTVRVEAANAGTISFDTGNLNAIVRIAENTTNGEVIFKRLLTLADVDYLIQAPANEGTILFQGNFIAGTGALGDPLISPNNIVRNIAGSGTVEFAGTAAFNGTTNIDTNIVFNDNVNVVSAKTLDLGGDVYLANGREIKLADSGSILTLKVGKRILAGTGAAAIPILAAGTTRAVITPGTLTTLRAEVPVPDDDENLNYKTLTLGGGAIGSIGGELRILETGLLRNATAITSITGSLTLEENALLVLAAPANTIGIGTTTLACPAGETFARLTAVDGEVSLKPNAITGAGSTLLIPDEFPGPTITVGATALTLAGVDLQLQYDGALVLASTRSVILESGAYPGKITLSEDTGTAYPGALNGTRINSGTGASNFAAINGIGALTGEFDETLPCTIGVLSGTAKGRLTIAGGASGSTIVQGLSVVE
ncbi:hypothetical protein LQZ21_11820 [Treponema sp. TIM-1]|uniref:hypothetical protein n=1 Tax=Treponema sp. TIM-1 TaxID=2898417 RepID=UPI0039802641